MEKGSILFITLVISILTGKCVPQNMCGLPKLCWCFNSRIVCIGENVYVLPIFSEPMRKATRILSIDSTNIRYLNNFKLHDWTNLMYLLIHGNKKLIQCDEVISNVKIEAKKRGVIVSASCMDYTSPSWPTSTDTISSSVLLTTSKETTQNGITITAGPTEWGYTSSYTNTEPTTSTYTGVEPTSTRNIENDKNNSEYWMKPIFISIGVVIVIIVSSALSYIIHVRRGKRNSVFKKQNISPIYLPTVYSTDV